MTLSQDVFNLSLRSIMGRYVLHPPKLVVGLVAEQNGLHHAEINANDNIYTPSVQLAILNLFQGTGRQSMAMKTTRQPPTGTQVTFPLNIRVSSALPSVIDIN